MNLLEKKISEIIDSEGAILFESFMEMALYEPEMGYYTSKDTDIGRAGDYFTSPHLHPIFGAMIGRQLEEFFSIMGEPEDFSVLEFGAGRGYLAKDILDYLRDKKIYKCLRYLISEINPFLAEKQKDLIKDHKDKVLWIDISKINPLIGCVISNELLDAFPVHLIEVRGKVKEIYVSIKDGIFIETLRDAPPSIYEYLKEFSIELPEGYRTEVNLRIKKWLKEIDQILNRGFILTIDYGYTAKDYYSEERSRGTLLCYKGHEISEDPYTDVGKKDITSHVNFSSLKRWADALGIETIGFCPQGTYLVSLGID
jgi:SAM-dependent MidA family methyltransferase